MERYASDQIAVRQFQLFNDEHQNIKYIKFQHTVDCSNTADEKVRQGDRLKSTMLWHS